MLSRQIPRIFFSRLTLRLTLGNPQATLSAPPMMRTKTRSAARGIGRDIIVDENSHEEIDTFNAYHDADIILRTSDGKDIWAHKLILGRASNVFRDMFQSSKAELRVPISEPADIIIDLLKIMYPDMKSRRIHVEGTWKKQKAPYGLYPKRLAQIERFTRLVELTSKYDMPAVQSKIATAAFSLSESCPVDCLGLSWRCAIDDQLGLLGMYAMEELCNDKESLLCSEDVKRALKTGLITGEEYYDLIQTANLYESERRP